jgi:hypothetical protein
MGGRQCLSLRQFYRQFKPPAYLHTYSELPTLSNLTQHPPLPLPPSHSRPRPRIHHDINPAHIRRLVRGEEERRVRGLPAGRLPAERHGARARGDFAAGVAGHGSVYVALLELVGGNLGRRGGEVGRRGLYGGGRLWRRKGICRGEKRIEEMKTSLQGKGATHHTNSITPDSPPLPRPRKRHIQP